MRKPVRTWSRGRVTQRCPGLSPRERDIRDFSGVWREYQDSLTNERLAKQAAALAPDAGRDTTDPEQQKGIPLEGWRIAARLRRLNPNLHFELANASPRRLGIYILDPLADQGKRFLCGMQTEINPEFEIKLKDATGECTGTQRGWRSVIAKLIRAKVISEAGAFKLFGPPSRDSENWFYAVS